MPYLDMVSYDFEKPVLYIVSDKEFDSRSDRRLTQVYAPS